MTDRRLDGKRVLVTQAKDYMGPDTMQIGSTSGVFGMSDK